MSGVGVRARPSPATQAWAAGGPRRALLALARVEAARLLRHPATLASLALLVGFWAYRWFTGQDRYPVLHQEDYDMQLVVLVVVGGAAMTASNLATLRAHRSGAEPLFAVLLLSPARRVAAHLLALLPLGLVVAALVTIRIVLLAAQPGAAGRFNGYELAISPLAVVVLGALGVLLCGLVRSVIIPLLVLPVLAVATLALAAPSTATRWPAWLLPVAYSYEQFALPRNLVARPAAAHVAYLIGVGALVSLAALGRAGARGRSLLAAAAAAAAIVTAAGSAHALPVDRSMVEGRVAAVEHPAQVQVCQRRGQVTYCAFRDFTPWIDAWDTVVRGVLRRVPVEVAGRPLAVRQRINHAGGNAIDASWPDQRRAIAESWRREDVAAGIPPSVPVGTTWGDVPEMALAGLVAYELLTGVGPTAYISVRVCGARAVLVGWLAPCSAHERGWVTSVGVDRR